MLNHVKLIHHIIYKIPYYFRILYLLYRIKPKTLTYKTFVKQLFLLYRTFDIYLFLWRYISDDDLSGSSL